jgi:ATP-binding cassette subfamily B protein
MARGVAAAGAAHIPSDDEVLARGYDARLMRRLLRYVLPHRNLLGLSLVLLLLVSAAQLTQPYLLKIAIDGPITSGTLRGLDLLALAYALVLCTELTFRYFQVVVTESIGQNVVFDMRTKLFGHLQRLSSSYFDRNPVGRLMTRVTSDVESLSEFFSLEVVTILVDFVKLAAIIGILLWMDIRLALVTFTVVPILLVLSHFFRLRLRDSYRAVRARIARINVALQEGISGMRVVQLFRRERRQAEEFDTTNRDHRDADLRAVIYDSTFSAVVEMIGTVSIGLIIWYGGGKILEGTLTLGTLVAFLEYTNRFFVPIRDLSAKYAVMQSAMASSERIFELLDTDPEIRRPAAPRPLPDNGASGRIDFRDVWFAYRPGEWVLRGISFSVEPGERVALVGATGAGKSSIIRLLIRLYDIQRGAIRVDGIDLREADPAELRHRVGIVLQDHYLFQGTIERNLTLADPRISPETARAAAAAAGAEEFIRALPNGYDEEIRERGSNLSVGQKQLLSFARALAYDPRILVLDEATSSVDSETERRIQEALSRLLAGRSSLIVAHRLSTVIGCDRIILLHHGEIREQGTHAELLRRGGLYATLCRLQFAGA